MQTETAFAGSRLTVRLTGALDAVSAPGLEAELKKLIPQTDELTFECSGLDYMSSAGLRILLATQKKLAENGRTLILKNVGGSVGEVLEMTGLADVFTIVREEAAAAHAEGDDYNMEKKLLREAPELHRIFSDNVICCQNTLLKYKTIFPTYTDHTVLHSLEVIAFCNELIGENIRKLNPDEIFVLLMAAYLHDSGMGISMKNYEEFSAELPMVQAFRREHPEEPVPEVVRRFHHEFSGAFIRKYRVLFEFPSEEHLFAVIQVSRGHRKTDLYDEAEYPAEYKLPNGSVIHLPYLAALIRLADEIDIAADRNIQFLYDVSAINNEVSRMEFEKHLAIKSLTFEKDHLLLSADMSDKRLRPSLEELFVKLNDTLNKCIAVVRARTPFDIRQTSIQVRRL